MRVVHVIPSLDPDSGGPARSVPDLCVAEQRAGVSVALITFARIQPELESVSVTCVNPFPGTRQGVTPAYFEAVRSVIAGADVAHLHSLWNPTISIAARAAYKARVPYVLSPRGMLQSASLSRKALSKRATYLVWERKTLARAAGMHFLTDSELADSKWVPSVPVIVLHNGVDDALSPSGPSGALKRAEPRVEDRMVVFFLGRLHWSKGLDLQLEAVARLMAARKDIVWVLVGPDEGEWAGIRAAAERLGIADRVFWLGRRSHEESIALLRDADVSVLASRHEAHSMAMNEALALGIPLVITRSVGFAAAAVAGAAIEVDGKAGDVASAIARVLDDPAVSGQLRKAGPAFARTELGWSSIAERMVDFYRTIGHPGPGGRG